MFYVVASNGGVGGGGIYFSTTSPTDSGWPRPDFIAKQLVENYGTAAEAKNAQKVSACIVCQVQQEYVTAEGLEDMRPEARFIPLTICKGIGKEQDGGVFVLSKPETLEIIKIIELFDDVSTFVKDLPDLISKEQARQQEIKAQSQPNLNSIGSKKFKYYMCVCVAPPAVQCYSDSSCDWLNAVRTWQGQVENSQDWKDSCKAPFKFLKGTPSFREIGRLKEVYCLVWISTGFDCSQKHARKTKLQQQQEFDRFQAEVRRMKPQIVILCMDYGARTAANVLKENGVVPCAVWMKKGVNSFETEVSPTASFFS